MKKIIIHAGVFHADEIAAVALYQAKYRAHAPVWRTNSPTAEDLDDVEVMVLDIGGRYEPALNNFDHHQDAALPSAAGLVLRHFYADEPRLQVLLQKSLVGYIDSVDRGDIIEGAHTPPTICAIIRSCNGLDELDKYGTAMDVMRTTVAAAIATAKAAIYGEELWAQVDKTGKVAITDSPQFIVGWKELAAADDIEFFVSPNERGGYQITSVDSRHFPIPPDPRQTFRHNSGFLAVYPTKEDAVSHANSLWRY